MIALTEIWIQFHVFQEIIHPAHVPFQRKSKAIILCFTCNLRPCGRLLCDHNRTVVSSKYNGIQMFEEFYCFKVLVITVLIGNPLAIFLAIIQIEHRCNCIYTEAVYMAFLDPVQCVGDQEVLDFRTSVIVDLGSPVRMLTLSRVFMLIDSSSIEIGKSMCILREMSRNPVEYNTDLVSVQVIHHIFEILCSTIPGSRCIISCYLISPGSVKWMLCNSHKFYMSISHLFDIGRQFMCKFTVIIKSRIILILCRMFLPRTQMYFIDCHRFTFLVKFRTLLHPGGIFPFVIRNVCNS